MCNLHLSPPRCKYLPILHCICLPDIGCRGLNSRVAVHHRKRHTADSVRLLCKRSHHHRAYPKADHSHSSMVFSRIRPLPICNRQNRICHPYKNNPQHGHCRNRHPEDIRCLPCIYHRHRTPGRYSPVSRRMHLSPCCRILPGTGGGFRDRVFHRFLNFHRSWEYRRMYLQGICR